MENQQSTRKWRLMAQIRVNYDREIFISQRYGGISNSFSKLIREFLSDSSLGIEPKFSFSRSSNEHLHELFKLSHLKLDPQRRFLSAKSGYSTALTLGPIRTISSLWAGGNPIQGRAEIFHATYYRPNLFERLPGQKLVCTVHDFIPEKLGWKGLRNPHIGKKSLILRADLIICVSQVTADELKENLGISDDRVEVVHHGVDFTESITPKESVVDNEKPKILYVGHRSGYKNFRVLLESLPILRLNMDFKLVVAGPILTNGEVDQLNSSVGESNWMFVESPSEHQLKCLYREAAVHCVTSKMEGFGMTILESMAQGTPAIVSSIGVFREICGDSGLYFKEDQPEDLASKLLDVLSAVNYKDISLSALSQASRFSWNKSASKLSSAYLKII